MRDYVHDRPGDRVARPGRSGDTRHAARVLDPAAAATPAGDLDSIEQGAEGWHRVEEQLVATSWSDEQALRDESLVEGAAADAVPDGHQHRRVGRPRLRRRRPRRGPRSQPRRRPLCPRRARGERAPRRLGLGPGHRRRRSAPARARHPGAVRELLHPGDPSAATRLVVRGPEIEQIQITGFDPAAAPPRMTVEVAIKGRRYIEDRRHHGRGQRRSSRGRTSFSEHWTFALAGDDAQPWRIVAVDAPVAAALRPPVAAEAGPNRNLHGRCSRSRTTSRPTASRWSRSR